MMILLFPAIFVKKFELHRNFVVVLCRNLSILGVKLFIFVDLK